MDCLHEDSPGWKLAPRRGYSGEGERPWLAVWLVLLERAMKCEGGLEGRLETWKASLGAFLLEFRRHPGRLTPAEVRDYLFRHGELGTAVTPRSLTTSMDVLAFFYRIVVPRPVLAEAAKHPFDHPQEPFLVESGIAEPENPVSQLPADTPLLKILREKLVENGATAYCASLSDWRPA